MSFTNRSCEKLTRPLLTQKMGDTDRPVAEPDPNMGTLINIWHDSSAAASGEGKLFLRIQTVANRGDVYAIFPMIKFYPRLPFTCRLVDIWAEETELAYPKSFSLEFTIAHEQPIVTKVAKKLFDPNQTVGTVASYMKQYILDPASRSLNLDISFSVETQFKAVAPHGIRMAFVTVTVPPVSFIGSTDYYAWRGLGFSAEQIESRTLGLAGGGDMTVYGFANETLNPLRLSATDSFDAGISTKSVYTSAKQVDLAKKLLQSGSGTLEGSAGIESEEEEEEEEEDDDDVEEEEFQDAEEVEEEGTGSPPVQGSPPPPPPPKQQPPKPTKPATTTTTTRTAKPTGSGVGRGSGVGLPVRSRSPVSPRRRRTRCPGAVCRFVPRWPGPGRRDSREFRGPVRCSRHPTNRCRCPWRRELPPRCSAGRG